MRVPPQLIGREQLLIAHRREGQNRHQQGEYEDALAFARRELRTRLDQPALVLGRGLGRQPAPAREIDGEADQHADARRAEAEMPRDLLAEETAHQRRHDHRDLDAQHEDLEGVGATQVARRVEVAHLRRDIALEEADANEKAGEREQEGLVERHEEMTERHGDGAEGDGAGAADPAVRDGAADQRGQIDEAAIEAGDRAAHGERGERSEQPFEHVAEGRKAPDPFDVAGLEQLLGAVEREQGRHAVVGETLPRLREGQIAQPAWMAEESAIGLIVVRGGSGGGVHSQKSTLS